MAAKTSGAAPGTAVVRSRMPANPGQRSRDALYLRHILDAIEKIERYVGIGHDEFMAASQWQDAVIRQLEIIGEAVKQLSHEVDLRQPRPPPTLPSSGGTSSGHLVRQEQTKR
jgi:hypothetical protein